jgi:hypothetical protein
MYIGSLCALENYFSHLGPTNRSLISIFVGAHIPLYRKPVFMISSSSYNFLMTVRDNSRV